MKKITFWLLPAVLLTFTAHGQSVSGYAFAQSAETYSAVVGTTSTATGDDGTQDAIPFGFSFPFGGAAYDTFSISVNGFIRLGNNIAPTNWVNQLAVNSPQRPLIAPFWDDHNQGTGTIKYSMAGTAPNRFVEVGWDNINPSGGGTTSTTAFGSFKLRLFETSGVIEFVYGPSMTAVTAFTASIGLNDANSFLSVSPVASVATVSGTVANNDITSVANLTGKKYTFTPQPMCSGMPVPGITVSSSASICADVGFTLSLSNPPAAFGLSYQWQSSEDGSDFADIDGAQSPTLTTTQTTETFYQCIVTCSGQTAASTAVLVAMNAVEDCYCLPTYTNGMTDGDLISNVVIPGTTLSNNTGTEPVNPYYTYFTGQPNYTAALQAGGNYTLEVTVGSYGQQHSTAWIDYNDDGVFAEEERIGFSAGEIGSFETASYTILLSCDASPGVHRLRIRNVWNTDSETIDPCANYGYGEVEDYDISILAGDSCAMPYGLVVSNVNSSSGIFTWSAGCGQNSWNVYIVENGGAIPSDTPTYTNVASPFVFSNLAPMTVYDIYVQGNCDNNGLSGWAGPVTFTTAPVAIANDDCSTALGMQVGGVFDDYAVTATNVGASTTLGEPNVTCATFGFGGDVWFSAVVPESGTLTFETQADPGSPLVDTGMAAYSGSCGGGLTPLGCSDDNGSNGFSILSLTNLTPGATVYARVWEYANDVAGTFRFSAYDASLHSAQFAPAALRYEPNPVADMLEISYDGLISDVSVLNMMGQRLLFTKVNASLSRLDLSSLATGNYLLRIRCGDDIRIVKIAKR